MTRSLPALAALLVLVGCGGDGDATDSSPTTGDDDDAVTCDVPQFDLTTMSCEQLAGAWRQTVEAGNDCTDASDCVVLRAHCEAWYQVDCFYTTNGGCVDATDLGAFEAAAAGCTTTGDSCICAGEQPVDCVNGECVIVGLTQ